MYKHYFGLREAPFGITPDTAFSFASRSFQEALNTLLVAVQNGEGFIAITGEVGTGKTHLCRKFLASLDSGYVSAYLPNPYLEPRTLLFALAEELGLPLPQQADQHQALKAITRALLDYARGGKKVVLCLDEVQAMPAESLEALRLLSNLETEKRKLIQVVLFGQPELDERLSAHHLRQLKSRITFAYRLAPLSRQETEYYVAHRLSVAGYGGAPLFSRRALALLHRASGGTPRLINVLAHKALMLVFGEGRRRVEARHVVLAARDTPAARPVRVEPGWLWSVAAGLGLGLLAGAWVALR
ncbi:ExeA family protein [Thiobacter aerophilum]|uniref:AAA family ATPase n=1 Tax=Thiobacter aerophilum TaxID=3121275 RepID=A0ABV0EHZ2_9BURK